MFDDVNEEHVSKAVSIILSDSKYKKKFLTDNDNDASQNISFKQHVPFLRKCLQTYSSHLRNIRMLNILSHVVEIVAISYPLIEKGLEFLGKDSFFYLNGHSLISISILLFVMHYQFKIQQFKPVRDKLLHSYDDPLYYAWKPSITAWESNNLGNTFFTDRPYWRRKLCTFLVKRIMPELLKDFEFLKKYKDFRAIYHFFQDTNAEDWWMIRIANRYLTSMNARLDAIDYANPTYVIIILIMNIVQSKKHVADYFFQIILIVTINIFYYIRGNENIKKTKHKLEKFENLLNWNYCSPVTSILSSRDSPLVIYTPFSR